MRDQGLEEMKLIGLVGYKESGKDTVLKCIRELLPQHQVLRHNFADPLKQEVANALQITIDELDAKKTQFRTLLQVWGTDVRRAVYGEDYWILRWGNTLNRLPVLPDVVVATDVRFPNESKMIKDCGGHLIRIIRPGKESDGHASEREIGSLAASTIIYNTGDLAHLKAQTNIALKYLDII
jgi:hypothetical protein